MSRRIRFVTGTQEHHRGKDGYTKPRKQHDPFAWADEKRKPKQHPRHVDQGPHPTPDEGQDPSTKDYPPTR